MLENREQEEMLAPIKKRSNNFNQTCNHNNHNNNKTKVLNVKLQYDLKFC